MTLATSGSITGFFYYGKTYFSPSARAQYYERAFWKVLDYKGKLA